MAASEEDDLHPLDSDEELEALMGMVKIDEKPKIKECVKGTGILYDEVMLQHQCEFDKGYPECPDRIRLPYKRCCELGLIDRCIHIPTRYATEDHILLQHTRSLLDKAIETTQYNLHQQKEFSAKYDSVFANKKSYECALAACGCTIEGMEQVIKEKIRNCFVMVRPPGHHSMENEFCGYCIFNNVAIAAKHALEEYKLERILIVDWDVHHGQATQDMFYDDPRVLYFSIHRYEYGEFWPNLRRSDYDYIGSGRGQGFNVNVPLNKTGMTDSDYLAILQQVLIPLAYEYSPQLILVSSGYDAALGCPEGEMCVSPAAYAHFITMLDRISHGRLCVILEGGYCLKSLSEGCALTLRALLGDPCPILKTTEEPCDSVTESILNVVKVLKPYWNCFINQDLLEEGEICEYEEICRFPPKPGIEFSTDVNRPDKYEIMGSKFFPSQSAEVIKQFDLRIDKLIAEVNLTVPPHRTCLVFDANMRGHKNIFMKSHPERPDRITSIYHAHTEFNLLQRCLRVPSRDATEEELLYIHSSDYLEDIKLTKEMSDFELKSKQSNYNSIYMCKKSYECALLSCGSVLNVVETVLSGKSRNGVAIVRPPGHHAEYDKCMGFCFFNNVAIATRYAQHKFGIKRVLILDWDVHHGNGTQHQFYDDPSVLFISLHRHDNGFFYPCSSDGDFFNVGTDEGQGYNINIPWNSHSMGNSEYLSAFHHIVMPIAYEFAPELVLVSAGFDSAKGDPLGGYNVLPSGYAHMTHMLSQLANGRVVLMLEGGYNLNSISVSMATCTSVLLGDPCPPVQPPSPCESAVQTIHEVIDTHKEYWKCLKFRVSVPDIKNHKDLIVDSEDQSIEKSERKTKNSKDDDSMDEDHSVQLESPDDGQLDSGDFLGVQPEPTDDHHNGRLDGHHNGQLGGKDIGQLDLTDEDLLGACGGSDQPNTVNDILKLQGVEQMFAVQPLSWCPHLPEVQTLPHSRLDTSAPCEECYETQENWICLVCYKVYCSRFQNEHMLFHGIESEHRMVLSYSDLSVWCYACDSYVDNEIIYPMKRAAHRDKFGEDLPT